MNGWRYVPEEPTAEMLAAAAVAVIPAPSRADVDLARKAAPMVMMVLPGRSSLEVVAGTIATMPEFYRQMIAAAPKPQAAESARTERSTEAWRALALRDYSTSAITAYVEGLERELACAKAAIPQGWALVPAELTAENGMKYHLSGDWSVRIDEEGHEVIIPWDTIKEIHREIVERSKRLLPTADGGAAS